MTTTSLNDREKQVCIAALNFFLKCKTESKNNPLVGQLNEFDILASAHTRAHCITALTKFGLDPQKIATLQK